MNILKGIIYRALRPWRGWVTLSHPVGGSLLILTLVLQHLTVGPHCVVYKQDKSLECGDAPRHPLSALSWLSPLSWMACDTRLMGANYDTAYLALGAPSPQTPRTILLPLVINGLIIASPMFQYGQITWSFVKRFVNLLPLCDAVISIVGLVWQLTRFITMY